MPTESSENLKKRDLEIFLEVNRKSIELETEVAGQNEDVLLALKNSSEKIDKVHKEMNDSSGKMMKDIQDIAKDIFRIQVLLATGIISIIVQIIQLINTLSK